MDIKISYDVILDGTGAVTGRTLLYYYDPGYTSGNKIFGVMRWIKPVRVLE
jgi:hypothetical protein